jgi:hypothetical protein
MSIPGLALALILLMGAGFGISRVLLRNQSKPWLELGALSWTFGAGYVSLGIWICSWFTHGKVLLTLVGGGALILALIGIRLPRPRAQVPSKPFSILEWALIAALVCQAGFVCYWHFRWVLGWDAMMIWEAKSRWAFQNGGALPADYFRELTLVNSQPHYPLLIPYLQSWLYLGIGEANQSWVRGVGTLFYFSAQIFLATSLQRMSGSRPLGLFVAILFPTVPYLFSSGAITGNADLPMGALYLASAGYALSWIQFRRPEDLRLLGLMAAVLPWCKREGKFLWLAVLIVPILILCREKKFRDLVLLSLPGIAVILAWNGFLKLIQVTPDDTYLPLGIQNLLLHSDRIGPIARFFVAELGNLENWGLWWVIAGASTLVLVIARRTQGIALLCIFAVPMTIYSGVFVFTKWPVYLLHMELAISRLLLHLVFTALLAFGMAFPRKKSNLAEPLAMSSDAAIDAPPSQETLGA